MYFNTIIIVEFCAKHKLTINEFFILYLTYKKDYKSIYKYMGEVEPYSMGINRIKSLEERGFCEEKNVIEGNNTKYYADMLILKPKFYNSLDKIFSLENAAEEVWEAFPAIIKNDGKNFPAKTISPEAFESVYMKAIKNNPETHKKVLKALDKQKKESSIMCGLLKWTECRQWEIETTNMKIESFSRDV